jgi:hypothetical protein
MKIRVTLALLLVLGIGTSVYCVERAPATASLGAACCIGNPNTPGPIPLPTPQHK